MAHSCPDCWEICFCRGDVDDLVLDGGRAVVLCRHCDDDEDDETQRILGED